MGLFKPIYMRDHFNEKQREKALRVIASMKDVDVLARLVRSDWDTFIGQSAVERLVELGSDEALATAVSQEWKPLTNWSVYKNNLRSSLYKALVDGIRDQRVLARLATTCGSLVEELAIERIDSQEILAGIAGNKAKPSARRQAVSRLTDAALLARLALSDADENIRRAAAGNAHLTDSHALARVALNDANAGVRRAAAGNAHMTDSHALAQIALSDADADVRRAAAGNAHMTDSHALAQIALNDANLLVLKAAVENPNLSDQDMAAIARQSKVGWVLNEIVPRLRDAAALAQIALESEDRAARHRAVKNLHLTDQAVLARVAIADPYPEIREECIRSRLTDPVMLARVARESEYPDSRKLALESPRFNDAALAEKIALEDPSEDVRCAAANSPTLADADALFRIATAPGDDQFAGSRMVAAMNLARLDPGRAIAPVVALMKKCQDKGISSQAARFLMEQYKAADDPAIRGSIATVPNGRYGQNIHSDCYTHTDESVHFDLPR